MKSQLEWNIEGVEFVQNGEGKKGKIFYKSVHHVHDTVFSEI